MKLDSIKDLEKVIKACRRLGVEIIKIGDVEIVLGKETLPRRKRSNGASPVGASLPGGIDENTRIELPDLISTDEPTEEQLLFGSSDPAVWNEQVN